MITGTVKVMRVAKDDMTQEEAKRDGYSWNRYLNYDTWQKVELTGNASVNTLIDAGVVYLDFHEGVCRAWLSAFIPDEQTRSNVDHLIMQPAGFVFSTDLLAGLAIEEISELNNMGCSGFGWMKQMSRFEYDHLHDCKCLDCREFISFPDYFCGPCKKAQDEAVFGGADPNDPWHTELQVDRMPPPFRYKTLPIALVDDWKAKVPRPSELWLPGTFHELPDEVVEKYMDDYKYGLRYRMYRSGKYKMKPVIDEFKLFGYFFADVQKEPLWSYINRSWLTPNRNRGMFYTYPHKPEGLIFPFDIGPDDHPFVVGRVIHDFKDEQSDEESDEESDEQSDEESDEE